MKRLVLAALLIGLASQASAEVIRAQCQVRFAKPGAQKAAMRRLEIDTSAKTLKVWDNFGAGWKLKGEHPIVGLRGDTLVLDNADGQTSSLNRKTGAYVFRNDATKLSITGRCRKAE